MKKVLILLSVFILNLFILISPSSVFGACSQRIGVSCAPGILLCPNLYQCCNNINECAPSNIPSPTPPLVADCDPWTCQPCTGTKKCIMTSLAKYQCMEPTLEGAECNPMSLCGGDCQAGYTCVRGGWMQYVCVAPGKNPADYNCNPWTNEPCTPQGKVCTHITGLGAYTCQTPTDLTGKSATLSATQICNFVSGSKNIDCTNCFNKPGVWTPFGCIETDPQAFVAKILKIAISIAGGIAFLMIIYGGFMIMISSGNPEKLTSGKEIITSAIAGLLLIVFSVVILRIIGYDILGIPGLG